MEHKINSSVFNIVLKSLKITWDNLSKIFRFLLYPVFGQFIGIILCFVPMFIAKFLGLDFAPLLLITLFGLAIGLTVFCHAFWQYLLSQGAIVQMAKKTITGENFVSLNVELESFSRRSREYVKYLLIICALGILIAIPAAFVGVVVFNLLGGSGNFASLFASLSQGGRPDFQGIMAAILGMIAFIAILSLLSVLITISLQTFVLNPMLTAYESIKKSIELAAKNYLKTIGLIIVSIVFMVLISLLVEGAAGLVTIFLPQKISGIITDLISNIFSNFFTTPFYIICLTWWYLKVSLIKD